MGKIGILVDSTSGINHEEAAKYGNMTMIPLYFLFGDETYEDGVDLTIDQFFDKAEELYEKSKISPTTSQPSIGRTFETLEKMLKDYDHIIYVTISNKLSGTYQSGVMAASEFGDKVTVFDTTATVTIQKEMAITASKMAKEDKSVKEITTKLEEMSKNFEILFVVNDLKHLQRTGRIGAAASAIGSALQLKPILEIKNGEVNSKVKIRNINKAIKKLLSCLDELNPTENDTLFIIQAKAPEYLEIVESYLKENYPNVKYTIDEMSPVIAVNTGPGVIGYGIIKNHCR